MSNQHVNQPLASSWPLVIEDCFVPQSAQLVIKVAHEYSEETCRVAIALAGMKASGEVELN